MNNCINQGRSFHITTNISIRLKRKKGFMLVKRWYIIIMVASSGPNNVKLEGGIIDGVFKSC